MMQQPLFRPGQDVFPPILHECFDIRPVKASEPSTSISFQASLQAQMLSQAQLHAHAQMMNMMSQSLVHHTHSFGRTISQQTRCVRSPHPTQPNHPRTTPFFFEFSDALVLVVSPFCSFCS